MDRKEYLRNYQREWVRKRRKAYFDDKVCAKCSNSSNLELHHTDPSTKVSHKIWSWSKEKRDKELEKCIVLCYDCHKLETIKQLTIARVCGTNEKYKQGCRCELCKKALRDFWKQRREKLVQLYGPRWKQNKQCSVPE